MKRLVAKLTGGPLDGVLVSVGENTTEIGGLDFQGYKPMEMREGTDDQGATTVEYVDKYVLREGSLREFVGEEAALAKAAWDESIQHDALVEFTYDAG